MLIQSVSPLTGETINTYETFSASHVDQIINKAYSNQENFRKLSISEISKLFANLYSVINSQKDTISQLIHNEVGKSLPDAQYMEVDDILTGINKYLSRLPSFKDAQKMSVDRNIFPDSAFGLMNQHVGVIGVIMPWNYPFWMPMSFIVPALMNGNPVVFKPSSYAIGVGLMIEKIFYQAGFPDYAIKTIIGGPSVGLEIVKSEKIGKIMFVGSAEVGIDIARRRVKNKHNELTLEMGGNSAAIIFDDANFKNSMDAVFWNSCYYAGQVCTRTKRLLIHKNIYDRSKNYLVELSQKYNQPDLLTEKIGPLITQGSMNIIEHRIKKAIKAGNILLEGGIRIPENKLPKKYQKGNFFPITVIEIKNRDVDILSRETFAPVLPLIKFDTIEEAMTIANNTNYGLSANIFTDDQDKINYLIDNLEAGMVFINDSEVAYPGGNYWKGFGGSYLSTGSEDKFECMYYKKVIWEKESSIRRDWWF